MKSIKNIIFVLITVIFLTLACDNDETNKAKVINVDPNPSDQNNNQSGLSADLTPPEIKSVSVNDENPDRVEIIFTEKVRVKNEGAFSVKLNDPSKNSKSKDLSIAQIYGDNSINLKLKLRVEITAQDSLSLSYDGSTCGIADMANNCLAPLADNFLVVNNIDPLKIVKLAQKALADQSLWEISFFQSDYPADNANLKEKAQRIVNDTLGEGVVTAEISYSSKPEVIIPATGEVVFGNNIADPLVPIEVQFQLTLVADSTKKITTDKIEIGVIGDFEDKFYKLAFFFDNIPYVIPYEGEQRYLDEKIQETIDDEIRTENITVQIKDATGHPAIDNDTFEIHFPTEANQVAESQFGDVNVELIKDNGDNGEKSVEIKMFVLILTQELSFLEALLEGDYLKSYTPETFFISLASYSRGEVEDIIEEITEYKTSVDGIDTEGLTDIQSTWGNQTYSYKTLISEMKSNIGLNETGYLALAGKVLENDGLSPDDVKEVFNIVVDDLYDDFDNAKDYATIARAYAYKAEAYKYQAQVDLYLAEACYYALQAKDKGVTGQDESSILLEVKRAFDKKGEADSQAGSLLGYANNIIVAEDEAYEDEDDNMDSCKDRAKDAKKYAAESRKAVDEIKEILEKYD